MDKKSTYIILALTLLALTVFVFVLLSRPSIEEAPTGEETASTTAWQNTPAEQKDVRVTPKTIITAKHSYNKGEHIFAGEIPLPTACHILEASGIVAADKKTVYLSFVSSIKSGDTCPEALTPARFKITVKADKNAQIIATLNGQEVTPNLIEAGPDENLDNFELYMKG